MKKCGQCASEVFVMLYEVKGGEMSSPGEVLGFRCALCGVIQNVRGQRVSPTGPITVEVMKSASS